jgi:hypothetical protein
LCFASSIFAHWVVFGKSMESQGLTVEQAIDALVYSLFDLDAQGGDTACGVDIKC